MVAAKWNWDIAFMLVNFGWKAAIAVMVNALAVTWLFRREFNQADPLKDIESVANKIPLSVVLIHLFLVLVVVFAHHPVVFMGLFLFFLGYTAAYERHQSPLILREALLVAFSWQD
jgi:hypothetical protein